MPKAHGGIARDAGRDHDDENEKTEIAGGWEEEPSTTIAQDDAAELLRNLGPEPVRRTLSGITGQLDEPTIDDPRNHRLPPTVSLTQARLVITGGNDAGQELAVQPGKAYTIGRAVDNDLVLTDITVSRKHFEIRHEGNAWVLVDRGSGNGTVVNGAIEDHPFALATGDTIEIGNTTFRFDIPNGAPRTLARTLDVALDRGLPRRHDSDDDEEQSTVAGKPIRDDRPPTRDERPPNRDERPPPADIPSAVRARPRTMPPPLPAAAPPPPPPPRARTASVMPPLPFHPPSGPPSSSMPVAGLPLPSLQPGGPRAPGGQAPTMLGDAMGLPRPGGHPGTVPPPIQPPAPSGVGAYGYPAANEIPAGSSPGRLVINVGNARDASGAQRMAPAPYPQAGHMGPGGHVNPLGATGPMGAMGMGSTGPMGAMGRHPQPPPYVAPQLSRRTKMILGGAAITLVAAITTAAILGGGPARGTAPATGETAPTPKVAPRVSPIEAAGSGSGAPTTKPGPRVEPIIEAGSAATPPPVAKVEPITPPVAKVEPVTPPVAKVEPPKPDRRDVPRDPPKDPPKDPQRKDPKRVAASEGSSAGALSKAEQQYRAKNFAGAATTLEAAAERAPDEARSLKSLAATYRQLGKAFNNGMAPNTSAKEAWAALSTARNLDNSAGNAFTSEITGKLGEIAPKAAVGFMAAKDYVKAKQAVALAESTGNGNSTTAGVKSTLEQKAGELYKQAKAEAASDPDAARLKYKLIQTMVDSKSPWHQKAGKELSAG